MGELPVHLAILTSQPNRHCRGNKLRLLLLVFQLYSTPSASRAVAVPQIPFAALAEMFYLAHSHHCSQPQHPQAPDEPTEDSRYRKFENEPRITLLKQGERCLGSSQFIF